MIVKYSTGSTYTLVANTVETGLAQDVTTYHAPLTNRNGGVELGLKLIAMKISGDILSKTACAWRDITEISLDGTSYQGVYFANISFGDDRWSGIYPYTLNLLVSPLLEGPAVRYPATGYKFGDQSITGISQAGNETAYPIIHYLAPLFYAPLKNDLLDFAGQGLGFARSASKVHAGISYGINVPIFDNGLYVSSETAQDTPTWTPVSSTVRSVALQIKQTRYPSPWVIGGGGVNLLTANQSNIETDTSGFTGTSGTMSRNTSNPIAGAADLKLVADGSGNALIDTGSAKTAVVVGQWYTFQALIKTSGCAAGRKIRFHIIWYRADGTTFIAEEGPLDFDPPTVPTLYSFVAKAPALAAYAMLQVAIMSAAAGETLYVDSLMLEQIPLTLTLWQSARNILTIDTVNDLLKWTDNDTATVQATFPTASYMAKALTDIVAIDGASHAVTLAAHPAGGSWTSQTGTLAALTWPALTIGNLEGSLSNLIEYPYTLNGGEYQAINYSPLPLVFNTLSIGNKYAGELIKGSDGRLINANGDDVSALLGGVDIPIKGTSVTIAQTQGLSARWYVEVKRTDI